MQFQAASKGDPQHVETLLAQLVKRLKTRDAALRQQCAKELYLFVATLSRQLSAETYTKVLQQLTPQLYALLQSSHDSDQLGGLAAIDLLIDCANEDQIIRFANYLRNFLAQPNTSRTALLAASKALGHLATANTTNGVSGTLVAAFVDFEVKRAFEWLQGERQEAIFSQRRLAACFVLRELAQSAPTLFHVNLTTFFQSIWGAIRDVRVEIREAATEALSACLQLIAKRQTRHRVQWYCKVYDQVFEGLNIPGGSRGAPSGGSSTASMLLTSSGPSSASSSHSLSAGSSMTISASSSSSHQPQAQPPSSASWECVHGSLLVIGELLQNTGGFMVPRFREVCDTVLLYKDAKDKLVSRTVCMLLPQLAEFCPDAFLRYYLNVALNHLMKRVVTLTSPSERGTAFLALGKMALAIGDHIVPHLPPILKLVKESLSQTTTKGKRRSKNKLFCIETLTCVAYLCRALGQRVEPYLPELLEIMMQGGLSDELVTSLTEIVESVPSCLPNVQERLLDEISVSLRGLPFAVTTSPTASSWHESSLGGARVSGRIDTRANEGTGASGGGQDSRRHSTEGRSSVTGAPTSSSPPVKQQTVVQVLWSSMKFSVGGGSSSQASLPGGDDEESGASSSAAMDSGYQLSPSPSPPRHRASVPILKGDTQDEIDVILLALRTLSGFNFCGHVSLLPFVRDCVAQYLTNSDPRVRKQAVVTCSQLLLPPTASAASNGVNAFGMTGPSLIPKRGPSGRVVDALVSQLLQVGTSDLDVHVRKSVVDSFARDSRYDDWLAQDTPLTMMFSMLNDEVPAIRECTMRLLERIAPKNPALVLPALRRMLVQLLTELTHAPRSDVRAQEDATRLLGLLIRSCGSGSHSGSMLSGASHHLVDPYVVRLLRLILPKLVQGNAALASAVLVTVGQLATVASHEMARHEKYLFPLILHTLQDHSSIEKRRLALQTLGQLAGSTSCVVRPYIAFPKLLELLLGVLQHSAATPWPLRREAMKTIGILGALDPYKYKLCVSRATLLEENQAIEATVESKYPAPGASTLSSSSQNEANPSSAMPTLQAQSAPSANRLDGVSPYALDIDLRALGVMFDSSSMERAHALMGTDMLDEKQQIELQLFTAAPIGTKQQAARSREHDALVGSGDDHSSAQLRRTGGHSSSDIEIGGLDDFENLLPADDRDLVLDPTDLSPAHDAYFPTVAISALLKILKTPTLGAHHHGVIQAIMFIFKSLQIQCVPFLPYIVPPFLRVLSRGEPRLRESLFLQLTTLVGIVQSHMKPFFKAILALSLRFWDYHLPQIMRLLEMMSQAAPLEFRQEYFPLLLPKLLQVLQPDTAHPELLFEGLIASRGGSDSGMILSSRRSSGMAGGGSAESVRSSGAGFVLDSHIADNDQGAGGGGDFSFSRVNEGGFGYGVAGSSGDKSTVVSNTSSGTSLNKTQNGQSVATAAIQTQVVQALVVFRDAVEDYVYLLVPALTRLMESFETTLDVKIMTIYALARICVVAKFEHYAGSRLLQPLARVVHQVTAKTSFFSRSGRASTSSLPPASAGSPSLNPNTGIPFSDQGPPSLPRASIGGAVGATAPTIATTRAEATKFSDVLLYAVAAIMYQLNRDILHFEPLILQLISALPAQNDRTTKDILDKILQAIDKLKRGERLDADWLLDDPVFVENPSLRTIRMELAASTVGGAGSGGSAAPSSGGVVSQRLHVNQQNLRRAWEASQRSTREDWLEWMRRFSIELLRESPSAALRSCCALAQAYNPLARELFNPAFVSCWNELYEQYQDYLVRALETAFQSETIPAEILQTLLNLAEFMEHDVEALPIDIRELGELAQKCHAYAKALHYKELEFHTSPATCIEALISINNQLGQPEAAVGILKYAQQHHGDVIDVQETWYEKLQDWNAALTLYNNKLSQLSDTLAPHGDGARETMATIVDVDVGVYIGKMRCLEALGEWDELASIAGQVYQHLQELKSTKKGRQPSSLSRSASGAGSLARLNSWSSNHSSSSSTGAIMGQISRHSSFNAAGPISGSGGQVSAEEGRDVAIKKVAMLGAKASWCLSHWDQMAKYVDIACGSNAPSISTMTVQASASSALAGTPSTLWNEESETESSLFRAVLAVHHNRFDDATKLIDGTRQRLDTKLGALVGESYSRAYKSMVTLQQLSELEEIVTYKTLRLAGVSKSEEAARYKRHLIRTWHARLQNGCKRVVDVWQQILAIRSLIVTPQEDIETWLQFASLCRQSGNLAMSLKVFTHVLGGVGRPSVSAHGLLNGNGAVGFGYGERDRNRVTFAYLKHLWTVGEKQGALQELTTLVGRLSAAGRHSRSGASGSLNTAASGMYGGGIPIGGNGAAPTRSGVGEEELLVKCHLKLAEWQLAVNDQQLDRVPVTSILASLKMCTELEPKSYKAWHAWALMNFHVVEHYSSRSAVTANGAATTANFAPHIAPAIEGFFRSIALGRSRWAANVQQDILRVLTLWFAYGHRADVHNSLVQGFSSVSIETWLIVIPQLIARIHTPYQRIQTQLHRLLCAIGAQHPHALIYPLSVALKSPLQVRQQAAEAIMSTMRRHYVDLVDEALLVSRELIRVAILWHEMWHEGLEEASRLYFGEHDVDGMVAVLAPLHEMMEQGPETLREVSFQQAFGRDLREAYEWLQRFLHGNRKNEGDLNRAWDLYYHVFRRINKQLPQLTTLELQYVSPNLLQARSLQLAVPGTYRAGHGIVTIGRFLPTIQVITSKQRPRRITIVGSNGLEYMFLLKGHEDLRQDERVTQLFGLVNALLINDRTTAKKDLKIHRYPVIPLSHNAGIVGWVPHCDTLHQLIRDYREARKILLNIEHRLMLQMAPDYDALPLLNKVEVFEYALENTAGQDLYKVLWLKSGNSEAWLERRTNYTRSLAVMSMVGYILGLGDRHPSNLMLHRFTGTIVHIDFGDCFEVAMHREKYPEKIPFRLTRMLTNAMEVSGIEGNFRFSCESVMGVLRENRHSLMAMLEAFVHDPLICWRLLAPNQRESMSTASPSHNSIGATPANRSDQNQQTSQQPNHPSVPGAGNEETGQSREADPNRAELTPKAPAPNNSVASRVDQTHESEMKDESGDNADVQDHQEAVEAVASTSLAASESADTSDTSSDDEDEDDVAESLSASAMIISKMPKRPRPQRGTQHMDDHPNPDQARESEAPSGARLNASRSRPPTISASVRTNRGLPPRPSTSVVSTSMRPMSMSKSIAFTRATNGSSRLSQRSAQAHDEDGESKEPIERIDHKTMNLHAEIATLAASVTSVGQGSLHRSFARTAAEAAVVAANSAQSAAPATQSEAESQPNAPQQEAEVSNTADQVDETAGDTATGVVRTRARRASMSGQTQGPPAPRPNQQSGVPGGNNAQQQQPAQSQTRADVHANRSHRERELLHALGPEGAAAPREALNEKAVAVIRRVQAKLTGRDFEGEREPLDVSAQVQRLISQAASHENLCQCYIGWCPFW